MHRVLKLMDETAVGALLCLLWMLSAKFNMDTLEAQVYADSALMINPDSLTCCYAHLSKDLVTHI